MTQEQVWRVEESAERLDRYVAAHCPQLTRSRAQRLIREGRVTVNGATVTPSYLPVPGDLVQVSIPAPASPTPQPEALPLEIVFEDRHLLVVNKPAGLVVHPAPGHPSGTLVNALLAHRPEVNAADLDPTRPGIVHRLDRDTSGLIVVAANREVQAALQAQWKSRKIVKRYLALVYGRVEPPQATIDAPLGRDPAHRQRIAVRESGGRAARTSYQVREHLAQATLLEVLLHTGRTHQIRVHLASVGYPVVGDRVYGPRRPTITAPRQMLHAWRLSFTHPVTGALLALEADPPPDFDTLLQLLRAT